METVNSRGWTSTSKNAALWAASETQPMIRTKEITAVRPWAYTNVDTGGEFEAANNSAL
jgi:hypothetical protein